MMAFTACVALGLFIVEEFGDGFPPRFVVRGIPARIARLRPGMTWPETQEILGLEKSWLRGGTSAAFAQGDGNGHHAHEVYLVRPLRIVKEWIGYAGRPPALTGVGRSRAMIQLWYATKFDSSIRDYRRDPATRLVRATFSSDSTVIAEMPRSQ